MVAVAMTRMRVSREDARNRLAAAIAEVQGAIDDFEPHASPMEAEYVEKAHDRLDALVRLLSLASFECARCDEVKPVDTAIAEARGWRIEAVAGGDRRWVCGECREGLR